MKLLKAGDLIVIAIVIAAGIISGFVMYGDNGEYVEILTDGRLYGEYSLREERSIFVETEYGWNKIKISEGKVWVYDASCEDKLDVLQGEIYKSGQSIVCLPNRLIVTVKGGAAVDALSY